jgi:hypothetical protein
MGEGLFIGSNPVPLALRIVNEIEVIPHPNKLCVIRKRQLPSPQGEGSTSEEVRKVRMGEGLVIGRLED